MVAGREEELIVGGANADGAEVGVAAEQDLERRAERRQVPLLRQLRAVQAHLLAQRLAGLQDRRPGVGDQARAVGETDQPQGQAGETDTDAQG